ncbi:survival of motor neuron-related-splicing factor 30-like isoform X2 [Schistocerca gregaria]|nr:survival of motor neuron-related-splicing factor 30-like isoform X2 [Schistocerca gregaria]
MSETISQDDLKSQLAEYEEQLQEIDALIEGDPTNEEYLALKQSTLELVLELRDVLKPATFLNVHETQTLPAGLNPSQSEGSTIEQPVSLAQVAIDSGLYVGLICDTVWPRDGQWYPAIIESISDVG